MQVVQKSDPSRQRENTEHSACNETRACDVRSCIETFAAENRQALIQIRWHVDLGDGGEDTEYRSPEYGFLESSPERRANASRRRQCPARAGSAFENRKRDRGDRNRTDREADSNADGSLGAINGQQQRNTYSGMIWKSKCQRQDSTVCSSIFSEIPRRIVGRNKEN